MPRVGAVEIEAWDRWAVSGAGRLRRARQRWRATAYEADPVRSDLVVVEGLAAISVLCAVVFSAVFVWLAVDDDYDLAWWSQGYQLLVAVAAAATWCALHTSRATWFYRHTDVVTLVTTSMLVTSPVVTNFDAGIGYPAFGISLVMVASAALLQRRAHLAIVLTIGSLAWTALAVRFGTGTGVATFVSSLIRTVLVAAVIHYVRLRTIDLLRDRYRSMDAARAQADSLSQRDELTGLFNRRGFQRNGSQLVARCAARSQPVTVMYLDVDGLKALNDTFGHDAGDATLVRLAHLLVHTFRADDVIARVGGDEFVVVLPGADDALALAGTASKELTDAGIAASIGLAIWTPGPVEPDLAELVHRADSAMYRHRSVR